MASIQIGDQAPAISGVSQTGQAVSLAEFFGQKVVVLYFYPQDNTPICTAEACAFRDAYEDFLAGGAVVIGISGDSRESHAQFASGRKLPFILLSDEDGAMRRAFGVPKTLGILAGRVTYVIDKQGIVRHIFNSQFSASKHVTEALAMVKKLATEAA
ncbi:MAG: peroxiredoxin [Pirellulaceae bacterium]|nr:peroxiredoxin [Pirellulaceae bacterium]